MRKIIFLIHASLDGYVADKNGGMDFILYDEDLAAYSYSLHDSTDAAIYGHTTYDMMEGYWPQVYENPEMADEGGQRHAQWAHDATKYVVSHGMEQPEWQNTVVVTGNIVEEFKKIKQQSGKDIWLLGSPSVAQHLTKYNLIDEYRINVNPVMLGGGLPLYGELDEPLNLKLLETKALPSGVVLLRYEPAS